MKKVLCACLAMLVLLCGAAMAEHFRCELPEEAWLGDNRVTFFVFFSPFHT